MALPNSPNQLSFSQFESEFGRNNKRSLGDYRVSDNYANDRGGHAAAVGDMPLDTGIPQSGEIKFSDFHGKRLNMVVDFYSGNERQRVNARKVYNQHSNRVRCVGGFRTRPADSGGTKVILHINDTIYSEKSNDRKRVAFRSGGWNTDTNLIIDVGGGGRVMGAGGDGGNGADNENEKGKNGKNGNSAIGLKYPATINVFSGGVVVGGGGGGGGGGGAYDTDKNDDELASGGGGGGGAGKPAGSGGKGGNSWEADGENGDNGSDYGGGNGGDGGDQEESQGGDGGNGGGSGSNGGSGEKGSGEKKSGGGSGGKHGYWIVTGGNSYNLNNSGTVSGGANGGAYT